ncbi:MAG TPA: transglutaminase family protein, partial [Polyangiales bacterium]
YFFAGHGIGGSSSTPRPDAGRDEALYELSLGLSRLPSGPSDAPWLADRALRHLLTDPAGDMKRAEIRTDRLFAPERASKRQGQVVIHAFETAPSPQLQALQQLLVQALIGRLARIPDSGALTRWGSALHDRFLLPRVLWEDLRSVVQDLNAVGYPFQLEWFEPFLALRFLRLGAVPIGEITLELTTALEPWPVLAEELAGGGIARFIDTANERVQVSLKGLTPDRYALVCNGERVPLRQVGDLGEYVAGVRYKVVNPSATMHPTVLPVDALVFDLLDLWTDRVVGGCTYLPGRSELWGPVGYPVASPAPRASDFAGELPPPVVALPEPSWATRPWSRPPRFLPRGSGFASIPAPSPRRDERPYLLDLIQQA